jgi:hypothetical protein
MMPRRTLPTVPRDVIPVTTYEQLDRYLGKFSSDELGLVLLLGRPGGGQERKRETRRVRARRRGR